MLKQKYTTSDNFEIFKKEMTNMRAKEAKTTVVKSDASVKEFKLLATQLIDEVGNISSNTQKNKMIDVIEAWSISLNDNEWRDELIAFCEKKGNITSAFVVSNGGKEEFIILMDDVTDDSVLEYNEFAFELRAKHNKIHDFMILDASMKDGIDGMFSKIEKIFERG